jgi:site-specific DNA-methyltransferase (adenine-specific)
MIKLNQIINADCMDIMKDIPDKYFELAIVDPPYGIGLDKYLKITKPSRPNSYFYPQKHKTKDWDSNIPDKKYFEELFRISKDQIIFGGNYFTEYLYPTNSWIFWDKINGEGSTFSDGELIWTSLKFCLKKFTCSVFEGTNGGKLRTHPTQKPVALYKWLLKNYAKSGNKILDTHAGSCSSVIACIDYGFEYLAIEKDKDYYEASLKRIDKELQKIKMFP